MTTPSPAQPSPAWRPSRDTADPVNLLHTARRYLEKGLSVIPLKPRGKEPLIPWKQYQERLPTEEELERWFGSGKEANVGIVTGRVSRNLVVIDFDSEEKFKGFVERLKSARKGLQIAISNTWIVKTGKGYHIYLRLPDAELVPRTKVRLAEGIDLKAEGGYVVAPPSLHPSGKRYEFVKVENEILGPPDVNEPALLTEEEWEELLKLLDAQKSSKSDFKGNSKVGSSPEKVAEEIAKLFEPFYIEGQRHIVSLAIGGALAKRKVPPEVAVKVVELLVEKDGDSELKDRIRAVLESYTPFWNVDELRGIASQNGINISTRNGGEIAGLKLLQEIGLKEEEIEEFRKRLNEVVGRRKKRKCYQVEKQNKGLVERRIMICISNKVTLVTRELKYEVKNGKGKPKRLNSNVKVIMPEVPEKVKLKYIDAVVELAYIPWLKLSVPFNELVSARYMREHQKWGSLVTYVLANHNLKVKEMYYVPGIWYNEDFEVIDEAEFRMPDFEPPRWGNTFREALEKGKVLYGCRFLKWVLSHYKRPEKALLAYLYALLGVFKYEVVEKVHYFPHLLIYGPINSGKSLILDLARVTLDTYDLNVNQAANTKFEVAKKLSIIKLPWLVDEANNIFNHDDPRMVNAVIERLSESVTSNYGWVHTKGVVALLKPVRPLIGATNELPDILAEMAKDKFLTISFHNVGFTEPKTDVVSVARKVKLHLQKFAWEFWERALPRIMQLGSRTAFQREVPRILIEEYCNICECDGGIQIPTLTTINDINRQVLIDEVLEELLKRVESGWVSVYRVRMSGSLAIDKMPSIWRDEDFIFIIEGDNGREIWIKGSLWNSLFPNQKAARKALEVLGGRRTKKNIPRVDGGVVDTRIVVIGDSVVVNNLYQAAKNLKRIKNE